MSSFDFTEASARGYEFVWERAGYLFRVGIPVLFVKVFCVLTAFMMAIPENSLTYGLIIFPGYAIEAVFMISLIRYYIFKEPIHIWGTPVLPPKEEISTPISLPAQSPTAQQKYRQAGMALYMLIILITLCSNGLMFSYESGGNVVADSAETEKIPALALITSAIMMMGIIAGFLWCLRLLYVHIPITLGFRFTDYLHSLKGLRSSFCILLTLVICTLPLLLIHAGVTNIIESAFSGSLGITIFFKAVADSIFVLFSTSVQIIAITYGICHMLGRSQ